MIKNMGNKLILTLNGENNMKREEIGFGCKQVSNEY